MLTRVISTLLPGPTFIPLRHLSASAAEPFYFRLPNDERDEALRASLSASGQQDSMVILEESNALTVLDGHRRLCAIRKIKQNGGEWEQVSVLRLSGRPSPASVFRFLAERHRGGDASYSVMEWARFTKAAEEAGLTLEEIARITGQPIHEVEDASDLAGAQARAAALLNETRLLASQALLLYRRWEEWCDRIGGARADEVLKAIVLHVRTAPPTPRSWRFLLDFYWKPDSPFMAPRPSA